MAKNDSDLIDRLRKGGLHRQVAKTLSQFSEGASKKALRAPRSAVGELRSLVEEIERRLPIATAAQSATGKPPGPGSTRSQADVPRGSRSRATGATAGGGAQRPVTERKSALAPTRKTAAAGGTRGARASRGQNRAKILESLKAGPETAAEIAQETGIRIGTVDTTLGTLATAGEVARVGRGYRLPPEFGLEAQRGTEDAEDGREHPAEASELADGAEREHEPVQADALEAPQHAETSGRPPSAQ